MIWAGGYWQTYDVTADYTVGADTTHEILLRAHHARIRQNGHLLGAQFFFGTLTGLTSVVIKVWRRRSDTAFDLVGSSNNVISNLVANTVNTVIFTSAIQNVREGDYVALQILGNGNGNNQLAIETNTNCEVLSVNSVPATTGFNWLAQTATSGLIRIKTYVADPPKVVWLGYSIFAGNNTHYNYCVERNVTEDGTLNAPESTIARHFNNVVKTSYQNMGVGGNAAATMLARYNQDVTALGCDVVVIQAGGNDALAGLSAATFLTSVSAMLDLAALFGHEVILTSVPPGTAFTHAQCLLIDQYNAGLAALATSHAARPVYVDLSDLLGTFRAGGPEGNKWNMKAGYGNGDGLHYLPLAHRLIGHRIAKAIGYAIPNPATARVTIND